MERQFVQLLGSPSNSRRNLSLRRPSAVRLRSGNYSSIQDPVTPGVGGVLPSRVVLPSRSPERTGQAFAGPIARDVQVVPNAIIGAMGEEHIAHLADRSDHNGLSRSGSMKQSNQRCQSNQKDYTNTSQPSIASSTRMAFSTETLHSTWVEEISKTVNRLKTQHEECIAQLNVDFAAKFSDVEQRMKVSTESHTDLMDRLHAIEVTGEENAKKVATVERKLSEIEERIGGACVAEVHNLINQHGVQTESIRANLNELGEILGLLSASRAAEQEDMTNLKDQLAGMKERFDMLSVTSASEIEHLCFILKSMEARFCENGSHRAQLDVAPASLGTGIKLTALPEHEGVGRGVGLRLAAKALANAFEPTAPVEDIADVCGGATSAALKDQSAAPSQDDTNIHVEPVPCDVRHGNSSHSHEQLAPLPHNPMMRTCYRITK